MNTSPTDKNILATCYNKGETKDSLICMYSILSCKKSVVLIKDGETTEENKSKQNSSQLNLVFMLLFVYLFRNFHYDKNTIYQTICRKEPVKQDEGLCRLNICFNLSS